MTRAGYVAAVVTLFLGWIIGVTLAHATAPPPEVKTVTETVTHTETVTKEVPYLTDECELALEQTKIVLDAATYLSGTNGGLSQIIGDTKRATTQEDVAALSRVQADLIDFEQDSFAAYHALGLELTKIDTMQADCLASEEDK